MATVDLPVRGATKSGWPRLPSILIERLGFLVFALALLFGGSYAAAADAFKVGDLEIVSPWARATPAGATVAGGYLTIVNHGTTADRLVSVASDISKKAEVHEMAVQDGVMTMRPVEGGLEIPAGGKVELKPDAYHVMFTGLKQQPKKGEAFDATLTFEKAGSVTVHFAVEGMGAKTGHDDMGGMKMDTN